LLILPFAHPEGLGWIRWKLQLDGGIGARTIFSNAPTTKVSITDPDEVVNEDGISMTFRDHSFGLLLERRSGGSTGDGWTADLVVWAFNP